MAASKVIMLGPRTLPAAIGNLFSPSTGITGGVGLPATLTNTYLVFRKIRVVNPTTNALIFGLWKQITIGATPVATKEFIFGALATLLVINAGSGSLVPAGSNVEWTGNARVEGNETDAFIVGGGATTAGVGNAGLTIEAEVEVGFI